MKAQDGLEFIRDRITELRLLRGLSEYELSYGIERSKGFIQGITSGRRAPSVEALLEIIDYLGVEPEEFFRKREKEDRALEEMRAEALLMSDGDREIVLHLMKEMNGKAKK